MLIRFWGVRGSIPSTGKRTHYYGGNTSCVEVLHGKQRIIFDAGTGMSQLGAQATKEGQKEFHIFLTHYHFDHISGLPFFQPLHQKNVTLHIYGPKGKNRSLQQNLKKFFSEEFFPVPFHRLPARLCFHTLGNKLIRIGSLEVHSFEANHPGGALGYTLFDQKRRMAYLTDHEPIKRYRHIRGIPSESYEQKLIRMLEGVDLLIHDAQYMDNKYAQFKGWGHSPWSYAVRFAERVHAKKLVLFHHDPDNDDTFLRTSLQMLRQRLKARKSPLKVSLAREGEIIQP